MNDTAFEKHYTIAQLVELWGYGKDTIRQRVAVEPGVLKVVGPNGKTSYRIPESVARRIHTKLLTPVKRLSLTLAR